MRAKEELVGHFMELIRRASTELPSDVVRALRKGWESEAPDSLAQKALETVLDNVRLAREGSAPICQDTGTPVAWIHYPETASSRMLRAAFEEAVRKATERAYLRPNAVETLTGRNTGHGAGKGIPHIHFEEWERPDMEVRLMLKGGGCENVGIQYKLPDSDLGAGRDLEGVRRVVLDSVVQAQGKGCAPGVLGVCIGGDRVSGFEESKVQLLRSLDDENPIPELAELESRLLEEGNRLEIGPMGFGGRTTLLGVKIGYMDRLPASYFVTVSYMCWADRRCGLRIDERRGHMAELRLPLSESEARELQVGMHLELTGRMLTGRDAAHKWLIEERRKEVLPYTEGTVIYHCGPVVRQHEDGTWEFVAAGPTTSIREEPYQADVIGQYGLRGVIGKGGMGAKTLAGLEKHGAVYLHAIGGAAQVLANAVKRVEKVFMLEEFGVPEALWVLEVERFPVVVTMDAHGGSLHTEVETVSRERLGELLVAS